MKKTKTKNLESRAVVRQEWNEHERGWGSRPDGFSLHKSVNDCKGFIRKYWDGMPDKVYGRAPDEYSAPSGGQSLVDVSEEIYQLIDKE
ncbi:MAG: hypothetical protein IH932_02295, partial [Thaumarchaeota archaeon]|nr:hypothetical protein [Nitrososphaerota archaeon]